MRAAGLLLLAAFAPMATGCIAAAAAIPLAAGAAVVRTQTKAPPAPSPASAQTFGKSSDASDYKVVRTDLTALPPPDAPANGVSGAAALQGYVERQAGATKASSGARRLSVLLARPGDLSAQHAECRASSSAVFVDLDPGRGSFDPLAPGMADAELARTLGTFRAQGIAVVWFSRLGENFAEGVRSALVENGLDPDGRDQIVLMRDIEERKQTRRAAIADFLCPIALVGDEKPDFDELYLYLKNPDSAVALDAMIGQGWFVLSPFAAAPDADGVILP